MVHGSRFSQTVTGSTLLKTYVCNIVHSKLFLYWQKEITEKEWMHVSMKLKKTEINLLETLKNSKWNSTAFTKMCHKCNLCNQFYISNTLFTSVCVILNQGSVTVRQVSIDIVHIIRSWTVAPFYLSGPCISALLICVKFWQSNLSQLSKLLLL